MKRIGIPLAITFSLFCISCKSYKEVIKGSYAVAIHTALEGDNSHILGTVTSKEDNKPIPNAGISVINKDIGTMTTEEGNFKISIEAGEYQLIINAVGYDDLHTRKFKLEKGKNLEFKVQLGTTKIYQRK